MRVVLNSLLTMKVQLSVELWAEPQLHQQKYQFLLLNSIQKKFCLNGTVSKIFHMISMLLDLNNGLLISLWMKLEAITINSQQLLKVLIMLLKISIIQLLLIHLSKQFISSKMLMLKVWIYLIATHLY